MDKSGNGISGSIEPKIPPHKLYRYMSMEGKYCDYAEQLFLKNEVFLSNPKRFNDPFESRIAVRIVGNRSKKKAFLKRRAKRRFGQISKADMRIKLNQAYGKMFSGSKKQNEKMFKDIIENSARNDFAVLCLSEKNDDILMWSHYANKHTGICVEFDIYNSMNLLFKSAPVNYTDCFPVLDYLNIDDVEKGNLAGLTKASHWKYESEWRIIDATGGEGTRTTPPSSITGVIFGCEIDPAVEQQIREWINLREESVSISHASRSQESYSLEIKIESQAMSTSK